MGQTTFNGTNLLQQLLEQQSLSQSQASQLMAGWLNEDIPPVLSGAILAAIQAKGVSAEELAGMAKVLQSQSLQPRATRRDRPVSIPAEPEEMGQRRLIFPRLSRLWLRRQGYRWLNTAIVQHQVRWDQPMCWNIWE